MHHLALNSFGIILLQKSNIKQLCVGVLINTNMLILSGNVRVTLKLHLLITVLTGDIKLVNTVSDTIEYPTRSVGMWDRVLVEYVITLLWVGAASCYICYVQSEMYTQSINHLDGFITTGYEPQRKPDPDTIFNYYHMAVTVKSQIIILATS